jgi:dTDP-4-amino-4,6-dideoxy-D-galactose acyltransferase
MVDLDICEFLQWDTDFFGYRIARVQGNRLTYHSIPEIMKWCSDNRIDCLYLLADPDHQDTIRYAEDHGFRLVDIRFTLQKKLANKIQSITTTEVESTLIRTAKELDIPILRNIASRIYQHSRFFSDSNFNRGKCSEMYEIWIQKSVEGFANIVFVAEVENIPVGYVTCILHEESHEAEFGLVGIDSQSQGQGIGSSLIRHAINWCELQGIETVNVATQGRNIYAQWLYQQCGFRSYSIQVWYHKWFNK